MSRPVWVPALASLMVALAAVGCDEQVTQPCDLCPGPPGYSEPTTPESVLVNLMTSYRRREIEAYAWVLAPDFVFKFTPTDVQDLGLEKDFWTRDEDSTGTSNLFRSSQVAAIRIELVYGPAVAVSDSTFPPGTMKIRVDQVNLEVDQSDAITWIVADQQDFFFRKGLESAGEDTTHWFLLEWRELEVGSQAPRVTGKLESLNEVTWGKIKGLYQAE